MNLKLMTYNIHKCIGGLDRSYRPQRIVETIQHYNPDVLLLQEVDDGVPRSRLDRQVDLLGDALRLEHRAFQLNVKLKRGGYGNAILSRFPIQETHTINLTVWPKKRRQALVVKLRIDEASATGHHQRTVVVANIHLGLASFERKRQLLTLLDSKVMSHVHRTTPTIVAGDFNDVWQNLSNGHLRSNEFQSAIGLTKTFPAALPIRSLDGIYFRGNLVAERGFAGHIKVARAASDHLPAIAEFKLK